MTWGEGGRVADMTKKSQLAWRGPLFANSTNWFGIRCFVPINPEPSKSKCIPHRRPFSILASPPNRLTPNLTKTTKTQITQSIIAKGWFYFSIRNVSLRKVEDLWNAFLCQQTLLCWKLFIGDYKVEIVYKHHQTLVGNGNFQVYWQTPNNNIPVLWNNPSAHGLLTATGKMDHAWVSLNWLNKYISLWYNCNLFSGVFTFSSSTLRLTGIKEWVIGWKTLQLWYLLKRVRFGIRVWSRNVKVSQ